MSVIVHHARLAKGGLIDRSKCISFRFDGGTFAGYAGDTLASALIANGVRLVGRSFKYHRPRGFLTAGSEEPNALIELRRGARREPNTKASIIELFDGLEATSQNRFPTLAFDFGAISSLFAGLFAAGFYYKTFMWPSSFWEELYEPLIRRAAGLGRASGVADPDKYEKATTFCDLLVIGAGPAGLAAALAAGRAGARVILCDEDFLPGGRLNGERLEIDDAPGSEWAARLTAELEALPEVRFMRRTTVFGSYDGGTYGALERVSDHFAVPPPGWPRQRLWHISARRAVLAAGAIERPLVFAGNDRPGVMMASSVRTYLNRFSAIAGRRAIVFTTTDDGWKTALDLKAAGLRIEAVIDARSEIAPELAREVAKDVGRILMGSTIVSTSGFQSLSGVVVRDSSGHLTRVSCDLLAMSGGWNPQIGLATHLGNKPRWSEQIAAFVPDELPSGLTTAGATRGSFGLAETLREGFEAGAEAVEALGFARPSRQNWCASDEKRGVRAFWYVADSNSKAFVDFQHDVTRSDIELAAREGFRSVELLKRYTTLGMGTDQGKTSNVNGQAIMAALTQRSISRIGTTISRPPHTPVAIGAFAAHRRGPNFVPTRITSSHEWAVAHGASFVESGQWLRARWFCRPGETNWLQIVSREVSTVRNHVGICDVSTLGKIDIQGPDAARLLDRVYTNLFSTLPTGKARYGLMLREDGFVMDDGTTARLGEESYIMSTTTARAAGVMQHLEHARQVLWPDLDVQMVSVTDQWSQYSIAGPKARLLLQRALGSAIDLSNHAFPHLSAAEFTWNRARARVFRLSFSGELAYELAVPAAYGDATLRILMEAGADFSVAPYGTEALGVMRIEKGHVAGSELNGTTTATDIGLGRMMSKKKDFIGRVLSQRPGLNEPSRPALVGFQSVNRTSRLRAGAHFIPIGAKASTANDEGYLSSVAFSPSLGRWIGLGFLARGPERLGERVRAYDPLRNSDVEVEICSPSFIDPEGARLHA